MKNVILVSILSIFLFSCKGPVAKKVAVVDNSIKVEVVSKVPGEFSNPAIIDGSNFASFLKSLRKIGDYDLMLNFTASSSVNKFGKEKIKTYYVEKFTNMSDLKLTNITDNSDGTKVLNFVNKNVATKSANSIVVVIENDSCKLVLTDLNKRLF